MSHTFLLATLLATIIAIAGSIALSQAPAFAGGTPGSGDADCDGATNSLDALLVLQADAGLLEASVPCRAAADVNMDTLLDSRDAALILGFAAGLVPELPAPPIPQSVLDAVLDVAAETLDVPRESVSVVAIETMVWADLCMGLAEPDELCAAVITSGWRITVVAGGRGGIWHAAAEFSSIRLAKLF